MTSPTGKSMDAITSLLAERQRYESWIATLETRRASTPTHVYERVRADYEKRLMAVMDQLAGRSTDLESTVSALAARVAELMNEETAKRDERAEAELRAAVGEFTPEQWNELSGKSDAEISRIAAKRGEVGSELAQVQDLLVQATRKSDALTPPLSAPAIRAEPFAAAPPSPAPAPVRSAPVMTTPPDLAAFAAAERPPAAPLVPPSAPAAPARAERPKDSMLPDFDELAFLKSVVGQRDAGQPGAVADRPLPPPPPAAAPVDVAPPAPMPTRAAPPPSPPPAAPAPSVSTQAPRTPAGAGPSVPERSGYLTTADLEARGLLGGSSMGGGTSRPASSVSPSTAPSDAAAASASSGASASRDEGPRISTSVPAFLKDVPAEQVKTLKCQECGTMNYPTEWYCERCGGELAAM